MRFRNSILLLIENFKNVYRILLYKLIIMLIGVALTSALLVPGLIEIFESAQFTALADGVEQFLLAFVPADGTGETLTAAKDALLGENGLLAQFVSYVAGKSTGIIWSVIGCAVVYLLQRFADTLCYFAIGGILNDKMGAYAESSFSSVYVSNLGKASIYSLIYVPLVFAFDLLMWALVILVLSYIPILIALFFAATIIVVCQALKLTFTSGWLPAMVVDNKQMKDVMFKRSDEEKRQSAKMFATYVTAVYLVIIVNVLATLFTFGSALLLTIPLSFFTFICIQFVNYYTLTGKKYFITFESIATNEARGDSEHFFDYIEPMQTEELEEVQTEEAVEPQAAEASEL